jgi:hypothetical protein
MLKFNTLLAEAGVDPQKTYLLRHQDRRLAGGRTVYSAWRFHKPDFEFYQSTQKWENRFEKGTFIASFVVAPDGDTLFVELYEVNDLQKLTSSVFDPLAQQDIPAGNAIHAMEHRENLTDFEQKVVIDWGAPENERGGNVRICRTKISSP